MKYVHFINFRLAVIIAFISTLSFSCKKENSEDPPVSPVAVKDIDGNPYHAVTIGSQVWLVENLKTTHYSDSTPIPPVKEQFTWAHLTTPAYCWVNNDSAGNKATYGALYNRFAVNTLKLCPAGWHVPTDKEWSKMLAYLGGTAVAGGKMKETGTTHWNSPNAGATNSSGFTGRAAGFRSNFGEFSGFGIYGFWWSTADSVPEATYADDLSYNSSLSQLGGYEEKYGFSVRCMKNN